MGVLPDLLYTVSLVYLQRAGLMKELLEHKAQQVLKIELLLITLRKKVIAQIHYSQELIESPHNEENNIFSNMFYKCR